MVKRVLSVLLPRSPADGGDMAVAALADPGCTGDWAVVTDMSEYSAYRGCGYELRCVVSQKGTVWALRCSHLAGARPRRSGIHFRISDLRQRDREDRAGNGIAHFADQLPPAAVGQVDVDDGEVALAKIDVARLGQRSAQGGHFEVGLLVEAHGQHGAQEGVAFDQHDAPSAAKAAALIVGHWRAHRVCLLPVRQPGYLSEGRPLALRPRLAAGLPFSQRSSKRCA
jgi:hypothetical protein